MEWGNSSKWGLIYFFVPQCVLLTLWTIGIKSDVISRTRPILQTRVAFIDNEYEHALRRCEVLGALAEEGQDEQTRESVSKPNSPSDKQRKKAQSVTIEFESELLY